MAPLVMQCVLQLAETAGLRLREQDIEAMGRWMAERQAALALPAPEKYLALFAAADSAGRRERELLAVRFSTRESYFFRDPGQFDLLASTILPELIERRADARRLRIWSAGCANGEEAYTLAIIVDELAARLAGWNVQILGSDISSAALQRMRRGTYGDWSFRILGGERKARNFRPEGTRWQIAPHLRALVSARQLDLVRESFADPDGGPAPFDLILCRNVFIYLDKDAVGRILAKFARVLGEGGYLVTGHAELFDQNLAPLSVRIFPQSTVLQKVAQPAAASPPARVSPSLAGRIAATAGRSAAPEVAPTTAAEDREQLLQSAWHHADRGRSSEAEQDCRKALAIDALDPRPHFLLAQLARERGDALAASALLNRVLYLDSSFVAAYLELGALDEKAGNSDRARQRYETARSALERLPANASVAPYGEATVADLLGYVEGLLRAPVAATTGTG